MSPVRALALLSASFCACACARGSAEGAPAPADTARAEAGAEPGVVSATGLTAEPATPAPASPSPAFPKESPSPGATAAPAAQPGTSITAGAQVPVENNAPARQGSSAGAAPSTPPTSEPAPTPTAVKPSAPAAPLPPLACGTASCAAYSVPMAGLVFPACCPPGTTNTCGLDTTTAPPTFDLRGCVALGQPGRPDPRCKDETVSFFPMTQARLQGCCRPRERRCGVAVSIPAIAGQAGAKLPPGADFGCLDARPFVSTQQPDYAPAACGDP